MEVGFIAHALQLIHGPAQHHLFQPNTKAALAALAQAGKLPANDADALAAADFFWRTIQGINRITGLSDRAETPPAAMLAPLLRATDTMDLADLRIAMDETSAIVRGIFDRIIRGDTKP